MVEDRARFVSPSVRQEPPQQKLALERKCLGELAGPTIGEDPVCVVADSVLDECGEDRYGIPPFGSEKVMDTTRVGWVPDPLDQAFPAELLQPQRKRSWGESVIPLENLAEGHIAEERHVPKHVQGPLPAETTEARTEGARCEFDYGLDRLVRRGHHRGSVYVQTAPPKILYDI